MREGGSAPFLRRRLHHHVPGHRALSRWNFGAKIVLSQNGHPPNGGVSCWLPQQHDMAPEDRRRFPTPRLARFGSAAQLARISGHWMFAAAPPWTSSQKGVRGPGSTTPTPHLKQTYSPETAEKLVLFLGDFLSVADMNPWRCWTPWGLILMMFYLFV